VCAQVVDGWPRRERLDPNLRPFWKVRGSLTVCDGLLLFNGRIVVPKVLQKETMGKLHDGHQGIEVSHESQISSLVARHHQPVDSDGQELFCL